jgi:hypothetical protein
MKQKMPDLISSKCGGEININLRQYTKLGNNSNVETFSEKQRLREFPNFRFLQKELAVNILWEIEILTPK